MCNGLENQQVLHSFRLECSEYGLGMHDIWFQHRYRYVRIRNNHIAGCAMFSTRIVIFAHTQTTPHTTARVRLHGDKATAANPLSFVSAC